MQTFLIISLGTILQGWLSEARLLQQFPGSPTQNSNVDIYPPIPGSNGPVNIPGKVDVAVSVGSNNNNLLQSTSNASFVRGLDCGSTVQMYAGNRAQVFSTNFGLANYYNNEACTWKFEANQCTLSAFCPCVDIPRSWECLGDFLKIRTDYILQNQRFCGGNKPGQPIYSDTDFLSVRFRSDGKITATGFTCFIRCEGPGMQIALPDNITCPNRTTLQS